MFYVRKAFRVGPMRLNLSKSGVGMSFGARGFRLGSGPRGAYIHAGRGGLYYRHFFGRSTPPAETPENTTMLPPTREEIRSRATVFCGFLALVGFIALPWWCAPVVVLWAIWAFHKIVPKGN